MKNKLIQMAAALLGPKLVRNLLAALGGWLTAHGAVVDTGSTASIVGGVVMVLITMVWSYVAKTDIARDDRLQVLAMVQATIGAVTSALNGWLVAQGYSGSPDDIVGVSLFLLNLGLSKTTRPDKSATGRPQ